MKNDKLTNMLKLEYEVLLQKLDQQGSSIDAPPVESFGEDDIPELKQWVAHLSRLARTPTS